MIFREHFIKALHLICIFSLLSGYAESLWATDALTPQYATQTNDLQLDDVDYLSSASEIPVEEQESNPARENQPMDDTLEDILHPDYQENLICALSRLNRPFDSDRLIQSFIATLLRPPRV